MLRPLVALLLLFNASGVVIAQTGQQRPPPDILPVIQMSQVMISELKAVCQADYPELKDPIEQAHRDWILYPVKIVILVNGKEYVSPQVAAMQQLVRDQLSKQEKQRTRRDCEGFRDGLKKMLERVPKEALAPFLPASEQ